MEDTTLPLVSVIIAFLNEERFLADAVESVLRQDYPHWELLLVDDGSTDQSTALAQRYAAQLPEQILYREHKGHVNKGLSASRNHGIRRSRGALVAFLDADDVWLPGKLTQQVAIFRAHPGLGMVAEASLYWHSWQEPAPPDVLIAVGAPADRVHEPTELSLLLYPLGEGAAPCPSGLLIRRQALVGAGSFEESFTGKYQLYEDQALLSKLYIREKIYVSSACNNWYRQRVGSIVQVVRQEGHYHAVRRYFLEWFAAYLTGNSLSNPALDEALVQALSVYQKSLMQPGFDAWLTKLNKLLTKLLTK